ncbi:MAG: ubiquinone/menaquinone biosynthesis methyltransferase [Deltaproteobacteria bacterium]|nr:ubiquinone/menaquinone biosynthesis methyltransferase [Deltaproteobacteria bacterium]
MNIAEMFTDIAPSYDTLNRWLSFSRDATWRRRAVEAIGMRLNLHVLDLCAGTLDMTQTLLQRFPHARITAVDFSQAMLDLGLKKIPRVFWPQVTCKCEDAQALSLPDASVDATLCAFGMRNIPDQGKSLSELARVLTPDGVLVILDFFRPTTWRSRLFAATYGRFVIPWLGGWISKRPQAYRYLHESTLAFYPVAAYRALLHTHGFDVTRSDPLSGGIAHLIVARKIA